MTHSIERLTQIHEHCTGGLDLRIKLSVCNEFKFIIRKGSKEFTFRKDVTRTRLHFVKGIKFNVTIGIRCSR